MKIRWLRLATLFLTLAFLFRHVTGLWTAAGWGLALFFLTVGQMLQVPGIVFIVVACAAWVAPLIVFGSDGVLALVRSLG